MGLTVNSISCCDFRSYRTFELHDIGSLTLVVGPNATGKTNLLEGIQLVTACTSFRGATAAHLVRQGAEVGRFTTNISGDGRQLEVELRVSPDKKQYLVNGKKKRPREVRGLLPSVLFSPEDLGLAKGSQSVKRSALDTLGSQISANYHAVLKDYEKILRQRNRGLKEGVAAAYLSSISEVLAQVGSQLYRLRVALMAELVPYLEETYREISQGREALQVMYVPSWLRHSVDSEQFSELEPADRNDAQAALVAAMEQDFAREQERGITLTGPQLDRIEFFLDGRNVQQFASQGQQRSLVLAYKMAEVRLIRDRIGYNPVLLLDDVMSELDGSRRAALLSLISGDIQTFVTATNAESFSESILKGAQLVNIGGEEHGR